jgi:mannosylfructose-phosphate synthase
MDMSGSPKLNRVCILNPQGYVSYPPDLGKTDNGGQITYIFQLAKALGKRGIKVDIITRRFDNLPEEEQVWDRVKIVRIKAGPDTFLPKEKLFEFIPELVDNFMIYIENSRKKYDIIHSHYYDGGYAGIMLAKMLDVPHIHTPHSLGKLKKMEMSLEDAPVQKLKPFYRYHVRIAAEQKIINSADAIVLLSETNRIQVLQNYLADFEKLYVIYSGVDTENFNLEKTSYDKEVKMKKNAILTVTRIAPTKGIDRLIEALNLIKNKIDFHYYLGGGVDEQTQSNEEREATELIRSLIKKYRLQDRITFLGKVPQEGVLPAYYRATDLFINPARFEMFGLTTQESMACGAVPIISQAAGSREIIIDGLNGYIVDTHNRKLLAETILKLLKDPKLIKKVSDNASFTIKEHYSWDKIVDKFIALYKKFL